MDSNDQFNGGPFGVPATKSANTSFIRDYRSVLDRSNIKSLIADAENRLESLKDESKTLKANIDKLKKFKYEIGSPVFHQKYGVCIITNIFLASPYMHFTSGENAHNKIAIELCGVLGSNILVSEEEIMEYNDSIKTLYER